MGFIFALVFSAVALAQPQVRPPAGPATPATFAHIPGDPQSPRPLALRLDKALAPFWANIDAGGEASYLIVGDSISNRLDSYNWHLRGHMLTRHGAGGEGYRAFGSGWGGQNNDLVSPPRGPLACVLSGDVFTPPPDGQRDPVWGPYTPDGRFTRIQNDGTVEAALFGPHVRVFYLAAPGHGNLSITFDGTLLATLPTDAPEITLRWFDFSAPDDSRRRTLRLTTDGPPVLLLGADMRTGRAGVTYHKVAQGGVGPDVFLTSATEPVSDLLGLLDPDVIFVMTDWSGAGQATYAQDMAALLDFYESAMPDSTVVLVSHHAFRPEMGPAADVLLELANARDYAYINIYDLFRDRAHLNARGYLIDTVHMSFEGGKWFGQWFDRLMRTAPAAVRTCADWNGDGTVSSDDFVAYSAEHQAGTPDADLNTDGAINGDDMRYFLSWYLSGSCY